MSYLGNSPVLSQQEYRNIDDISGSFNGSTTSFALLVNGVAPVPAPQSSNQCLISVNGVIQKPDDTGATGFRLSGGNIVFSAAPTGGQAFFGVILAGADYIYAGQNYPDGTVSAPSITFAQDLDTGFYRSGAGEVKFTANGANTVTLSSNNLTAPSFIPTSSSAPTNGVYLPAANTVGISTNGTGRLFINSSGQVGVGTSSPASKLTIAGTQGNFRVDPDSVANEVQLLTTVPDNSGFRNYRIRSNQLFLDTSGSTALTIDTSQRVGVGTTSPLEKLHVSGGSVLVTGELQGVRASSTALDYSSSQTRLIAMGPDASTTAPILFLNGTSSAVTEKVRIDSSGRVGIGSSSPVSALTVVGSAGSGDAGVQITSGSTTTGSKAALFFIPSTTPSFSTGSAIKSERLSPDGCDLQFFTVSSLGNSPVRAMTIDSSQRVGIGTTSPSYALDVQGSQGVGLQIFENSSGNNRRLRITQESSGVTYDATYSLNGNTHRWLIGGGETMRLDANGRLLVGTSSAIAALEPSIQTARSSGAFLALGRDDTSITDDETLGAIYFYGNQGSSWSNSARIEAKADATWGTNDYPSKLVFSTCPDSSATPVERMRIDSGGNLIVAGITPGAAGSIALRGDGLLQSKPVYGLAVSTSTRAMYMDSDGFLGYITSVRESKTNIKAQSNVDWLYQLEPVSFNYKTKDRETGEYIGVDPQPQFGLIAEDVEGVCPELCFYDQTESGKELRGVQYEKLITPMLKALQQANQRIETLEAEVAALKAQ